MDTKCVDCTILKGYLNIYNSVITYSLLPIHWGQPENLIVMKILFHFNVITSGYLIVMKILFDFNVITSGNVSVFITWILKLEIFLQF